MYFGRKRLAVSKTLFGEIRSRALNVYLSRNGQSLAQARTRGYTKQSLKCFG
jgi:hypothetical protein